jgi:hypothetical protein
MMALARVLRDLKIYPLDALREAIGARAAFAEENLAAVEATISGP